MEETKDENLQFGFIRDRIKGFIGIFKKNKLFVG